MEKYLLIPKNKTYVDRQRIQVDGKTFLIDEINEIKGIVLDENPDLSEYNSEIGYKFENYRFLHNKDERIRREIIFEDNFTTQEKDQIEGLIAEGIYSYQYSEYGWEKILAERLVYGELDVKVVPFNELSLFTGTMQAAKCEISKEDFLRYKSEGMPASTYEELKDYTDFSSPIFSDYSSLTKNGEEVEGFIEYLQHSIDQAINELTYTNQINTNNENAEGTEEVGEKATKKVKRKPKPHMFSYSAWTKRAWYSLKIYEDFDISRLKPVIERNYVYPSESPTFTYELTYLCDDGESQTFEFDSDYGTNSDSSYIYDSKGKPFDFVVNEDDEDEDEDEDEDDEEDDDD